MLKELDERYRGYVGVDEAGRGCCGGALIFVGVQLKDDIPLENISFAVDSKTTSKKKRIDMAKRLKPLLNIKAVTKTAKEVDEKGLSCCIVECLTEIRDYFKDFIIYDGNCSYKVDGIETLVKADAKVSLVAAASIFAKLLKDKDSEMIHKEFPEYGFDSHSGYVNELHTNNIIKYGYCKYHRKSYNIKKLSGLILPIRD